MEPNFVLMKLPGETGEEFVEILPFTPANRNNLIGWIAGRSDGEQYGTSVVYNFPKTKLVDGPLQIEARIDQNAQLSGQLTLWNQQGSHVRRGALLVIPIGRALLYAEPITCRPNGVRCRNCVWSYSHYKIGCHTDRPSSRPWRPFRWSRLVDELCASPAESDRKTSAPPRNPSPQRISTRSSRKAPKTSPTISA